jgi:hypothetical protein
MIPTVVRIKIKAEKRKGWSLWIPLPPVYLFALILIILLSPILLVAVIVLAIVKETRIVRVLPAIFIFISSLGGLDIDINSKDSKVYLSIQ